MGGNALKNTETRRYALDEYKRIASVVEIKMLSFANVPTCHVIRSIHNKETFGDLDVLYSTWSETPLRREQIHDMFRPNEIVKNGDVMSFNVEQLQVDAIHVPSSSYYYAANYFAWNDLGNLCGKLFHKFGLKHGHQGLVLPLRDGTHNFEDIKLTLNHDDTLKFIGLDPVTYANGFDTLEEMFDYVSSSPYYNPDFYKLENLNTIAKVRDRKRETYNRFLAFGETYSGPVFTDFHKDKSKYLDMIFDVFPHAYAKFEEANVKLAARKFLRQKFNGDIVAELTGLSGKKLGAFMQHLRNQFDFKDAVMMYHPEATIRQNILDTFDSFCYDTRNEK